MSRAAKNTSGTGRGCLIALAAIVWAAFTPLPAWADKQVIFAPLTDGPDLDDAMEFFSDYFKSDPKAYTSKVPLEEPSTARTPNKALDLYLRKFVKMGKGDIDDDGVAERFYILRDPGFCGSRGCNILIVQKRTAGWKVLCEDSGVDHWVWITDWVSTSGYRELMTMFRVYWHGDKCYDDDPELLNEYKPEHYPRPPTERHWKPLK